tara:strand:- start:265 stop:1236 length:972 start_codon:yes stop_codon:yes gene_type:complete
MAKITDMYMYDGDLLEVNEHNKNVFAHTPTRSIMGAANGNISSENFNAVFDGTIHRTSDDAKIKAHHVQPGETHITDQAHGMETLDLWNKAFGRSEGGQNIAASARHDELAHYAAIPGCSTRIYLPYDCAAVMFQWSFHYSVARTWGLEEHLPEDEDDDTVVLRLNSRSPIIAHRAFYNGNPITATYRNFPQTYFYRDHEDEEEDSDGVTVRKHGSQVSTESRNARQTDFHYMATNVKKGWHELSARIKMDPSTRILDEGVYLKTAREGQKKTARYRYSPSYLNNRITFGIRNARAIAFAAPPVRLAQIVSSSITGLRETEDE